MDRPFRSDDDEPRGEVQVRPEDAGITVRFHDGNFLVDGVDQRTLIASGLLVIVCAPDDGPGRSRTHAAARGDAFESAKALAHFLHGNPAYADMVLGMLKIVRSGQLSGEGG